MKHDTAKLFLGIWVINQGVYKPCKCSFLSERFLRLFKIVCLIVILMELARICSHTLHSEFYRSIQNVLTLSMILVFSQPLVRGMLGVESACLFGY